MLWYVSQKFVLMMMMITLINLLENRLIYVYILRVRIWNEHNIREQQSYFDLQFN